MSVWSYGEIRDREQSQPLWNTEFSRRAVTRISLLNFTDGWIKSKNSSPESIFCDGKKQNHHHTEKRVHFPLEFSVTAQCIFPNSRFLLCYIHFISTLSALSFESVSQEEVLYHQDISSFPLSKKCKYLEFFFWERKQHIIKELVEDNISVSCPCLFDLSQGT